MSNFDNLMLELHAEAQKLAFEEAEKILLLEKSFLALDRLKRIKENRIQENNTNERVS